MVAERLKEIVQCVGFGGGRSRSDWRVLLDLDRPADAQMACDVQLAKDANPAARVFLWSSPAISLGLKQPRPAWLSSVRWAGSGCSCIERPTGGGIAVHSSDVSIAIVVPRTLGLSLDLLMRSIGRSAARLCRSFGVEAALSAESGNGQRIAYCLAERSPYAVTIKDRKAGGFAVRRYPHSWLIQGSLLVQPIPAVLMGAMDQDAAVRLSERSIPLSEAMPEPVTEAQVAQRWAAEWAAWWDGL